MRPRPIPDGPTDLQHWANLFTSARLRKGWSYQRLACEAELAFSTTHQACTTGQCSSRTALKLVTALGLMLTLPAPARVLTAQQAQRG